MSFRELIGDMFNEPRVGWYNQDKNLMAQKLGRMGGGTFYPHLVNKYDPSKVRFIDEPKDIGTYQKVKIPRNSEVTESGRYYRVSPKDIIPYNEAVTTGNVLKSIVNKTPYGLVLPMVTAQALEERKKIDSINRIKENELMKNRLRNMTMDIHVDPNWALREYLIKNYK